MMTKLNENALLLNCSFLFRLETKKATIKQESPAIAD